MWWWNVWVACILVSDKKQVFSGLMEGPATTWLFFREPGLWPTKATHRVEMPTPTPVPSLAAARQYLLCHWCWEHLSWWQAGRGDCWILKQRVLFIPWGRSYRLLWQNVTLFQIGVSKIVNYLLSANEEMDIEKKTFTLAIIKFVGVSRNLLALFLALR